MLARCYFFAAGGSSRIQGQIDIVFTLPLLFLTIVIFIKSSYFAAAGGSSRIQGQIDIVFTLPLLFLITVTFMARSFCARGAPNVLRK